MSLVFDLKVGTGVLHEKLQIFYFCFVGSFFCSSFLGKLICFCEAFFVQSIF